MEISSLPSTGVVAYAYAGVLVRDNVTTISSETHFMLRIVCEDDARGGDTVRDALLIHRYTAHMLVLSFVLALFA